MKINKIPQNSIKKGLIMTPENAKEGNRICVFFSLKGINFKFFIGKISENKTTNDDLSSMCFKTEMLDDKSIQECFEKFVNGDTLTIDNLFLKKWKIEDYKKHKKSF